MSTENYQPGLEEGAAPPPAPEPEVSVGAQLRAVREQLGLSVIDVAQRLKFAPRQVDALEADNMSALPGLTFVRGFVRSYAKLLGLEGDTLVAQLERAAARDIGPSTVQLQSLTATPQRFPMRQSSPGSAWPWLIAMVVAVVGLGGFTLYQWQAPEGMTQPAAPAAGNAPAAASAPVAPPNVTPVATEPAPAPDAAASAGAQATAAQALKPDSKPDAKADAKTDAKADGKDAAKGSGKIHIVFVEESWTEVRQAGGQVLYSKQSPAGSDTWLDGQGPFDFVIGNAQGVKLYYQGKEVDIKPYIKLTVARMQLK